MAFGFLKKLTAGLARTRQSIAAGFQKVISIGRRLDAATAANDGKRVLVAYTEARGVDDVKVLARLVK